MGLLYLLSIGKMVYLLILDLINSLLNHKTEPNSIDEPHPNSIQLIETCTLIMDPFTESLRKQLDLAGEKPHLK